VIEGRRGSGSEGGGEGRRRRERETKWTDVWIYVCVGWCDKTDIKIKDCRLVGKPNTRLELDFKRPGPRSTGFEERNQWCPLLALLRVPAHSAHENKIRHNMNEIFCFLHCYATLEGLLGAISKLRTRRRIVSSQTCAMLDVSLPPLCEWNFCYSGLWGRVGK
jgi:hypothetical protein